ncbi:MAG: NADPH-dependent FMN reductase [Dokdonella sp.]
MTISQIHPLSLRILAIPGSLRSHSYNRHLLEAGSRCAPAGMQVHIYDALGEVPMFDEDLEAATHGGPEAVFQLRAAVDAADGLLIATPEYNQSFPGVLKNAIEWLSRSAPEEVLVGKPIAITGASSGRWGTRLAQAALRHTLAATESIVMPAPMLFVGNAESLFDTEGHLQDVSTLSSLRAFMSAFGQWIEHAGAKSLKGVA